MKKQMMISIACFVAVVLIGFCSKGRDKGVSSGSADAQETQTTEIAKPMGIRVSQEIDIGFAALTVSAISESQKTPVTGTPPKKKESRFVLVDLVFKRLQADQSIETVNFLLKTREGEKFCPPGFFCTLGGQRVEGRDDGSNFIIRGEGTAFQLFFEVPKSIAIRDLDISYAPWVPPSSKKK